MKNVEMVFSGGRVMIKEDTVNKMLKKGYTIVDSGEPVEDTTVDSASTVVMDIDWTEELVNEVKKIKRNDTLNDFVDKHDIDINLNEFSKISEKRSAVINILRNK